MTYSLEQAKQEAENLRAALVSPGWNILEREAKDRLEALKAQLILAPAPEVPALQAKAQAYAFVLQFPKDFLSAVERATESAPSQDAASIE